eukprot:766725-Hanusia_phi.AAC.6
MSVRTRRFEPHFQRFRHMISRPPLPLFPLLFLFLSLPLPVLLPSLLARSVRVKHPVIPGTEAVVFQDSLVSPLLLIGPLVVSFLLLLALPSATRLLQLMQPGLEVRAELFLVDRERARV